VSAAFGELAVPPAEPAYAGPLAKYPALVKPSVSAAFS